MPLPPCLSLSPFMISFLGCSWLPLPPCLPWWSQFWAALGCRCRLVSQACSSEMLSGVYAGTICCTFNPVIFTVPHARIACVESDVTVSIQVPLTARHWCGVLQFPSLHMEDFAGIYWNPIWDINPVEFDSLLTYFYFTCITTCPIASSTVSAIQTITTAIQCH